MSGGKPIEIAVSASSKASPADVFALLKDGATWPRWSLFRTFELARAGAPDPLGVGAIRVFVSASRRVHEEIVEIAEGHQLSYVLRSGMPFRNYRADVRLERRASGGTAIFWQAHFEVERPGSRWFWKLVMQWVLGSTTKRLANAITDASILYAAQANIAMSQELPPGRQ